MGDPLPSRHVVVRAGLRRLGANHGCCGEGWGGETMGQLWLGWVGRARAQQELVVGDGGGRLLCVWCQCGSAS